MIHESGNISIMPKIFSYIKKWLYSEKDIFIRELVSNSSDAISKLKKLAAMGKHK
jgi:molecular chaperone HtpG